MENMYDKLCGLGCSMDMKINQNFQVSSVELATNRFVWQCSKHSLLPLTIILSSLQHLYAIWDAHPQTRMTLYQSQRNAKINKNNKCFHMDSSPRPSTQKVCLVMMSSGGCLLQNPVPLWQKVWNNRSLQNQSLQSSDKLWFLLGFHTCAVTAHRLTLKTIMFDGRGSVWRTWNI